MYRSVIIIVISILTQIIMINVSAKINQLYRIRPYWQSLNHWYCVRKSFVVNENNND